MMRLLPLRELRAAMLARARRPPPLPEMRRFTVEEVDHVLLGLSALERAVYLNHRKGGLSYAVIARRLGITTEDVEGIMRRAYYHLICGFREIENARAR